MMPQNCLLISFISLGVFVCVPMDLGVDLNLDSLWEVNSIHPVFEEKENANSKGEKRVKARVLFGREKTSKAVFCCRRETAIFIL